MTGLRPADDIRADLELAKNGAPDDSEPAKWRLADDIAPLLAQVETLTEERDAATETARRLGRFESEVAQLRREREQNWLHAYTEGTDARFTEIEAEVARYKAAIEAAEGHAKVEAERHQPEPGGCICGFCAWSVEHVVVMSLRAAFAAVDSPSRLPRATTPTPDARASGGSFQASPVAAALVVPVGTTSNVQRQGLDVPSDAPTPVDDQQDEPKR